MKALKLGEIIDVKLEVKLSVNGCEGCYFNPFSSNDGICLSPYSCAVKNIQDNYDIIFAEVKETK